MSQPQIVIEDWKPSDRGADREVKGAWKDRSTILISPVYSKGIHPRIVMNWMNIQPAMNQKFTKIMPIDMEVGEAYSWAIEEILKNPELSKWKYIATLEHDNVVPGDWLLNMYPDMEGKKGYDCLGAIYYVKGDGGKPMCYGRPGEIANFIPFEPAANAVTACNGLGMGANLFKLDIFKNPKLPKPFFKTVQENGKAYTQDLKFYENAGLLGYKIGCTTKVRSGHMDLNTGRIY